MPYCRPLVPIALLAILAFFIGCSSGGSSPVAPEQAATDGVPVVGMAQADGVYNMVGIMGAYELILDADNMTADLVTKREVTIGESYVVSGLGFFTQAPCADCLSIAGVDFVTDALGSYFVLQYNIDHPFDPGDPLQPPTAANRLDLDVFDLAMVIVPVGGTAESYALTGADAYANICAKADGYTADLANVTGDTAACPYFLVVDDAEAATNTNNVFAMGAEDVLFDVYFLGGGQFDVYLTMGYGFSAKKAQRLDPKYYIPEFNKKSAWKVDVGIPSGEDVPAMGNTWDDTDNTTTYDITVNVYDWQQGVAASTTVPYDDETDTSLVYAVSNVASVSCEIPGMFDTLMEMTAADSGTGAPDDPLVYTFAVANENDLDAGTYYGMVKVADERVPAAEVGTTDFLIDSPDGIELINYVMPEFATYQIFPAVVVVGCGPITGSIDNACPLSGIRDGQNINFSATAASDNGGDPIVLYEWDMDYDGTTFDVDATGQAVALGPFDNPNCGGTDDPVDYTVAVRASDSCTPPNVTIFDTCTVTVDDCTAVPIISIDFEPMPTGDTFFDIGVHQGSYVYVSADHVDTSNTSGNCDSGQRTALRYDIGTLDNMTVMNETDGMADPYPGARTWIGEWEQLDVSENGYIITNQCRAGMGTWSVSGNTATNQACCWAWACFSPSEICDISDHDAPSYGASVIGYGKTSANCTTEDYWCLGFAESNIATYSAYNVATGTAIFPFANWLDSAAGMDAIDGYNYALVLYNSDTEGYIGYTGDLYALNYTLSVDQTWGTYGTADEQFTGALDIAIDSLDNVVTLEDHGGGYFRFQKWNGDWTTPSLTWEYTSEWVDDGNPLRMDFDKATDELYVVTDTGVHRCTVL